MQMTPILAVHMTTAILAVLTGPIALWARRAFGYAWVTLMLVAAISSIFIRDFALPNISGYTWIHMFVPVTLGMLLAAFRFLYRGNIKGHRKTMQGLYVGACVIAGGFTLLPSRYLGQQLWGDWLGLL